jgi:hypothetical protein
MRYPTPFRPLFAIVAFFGLGVGTLAGAVHAAPASEPSLRPAAEAALDPQSVEQATLAALLSTAESMSAGRAVQVDVIDLRAMPDSLVTFALEGVGRIRIDNGDWIPLRFHAGYDVDVQEVFGLRVQPIATTSTGAGRTVESGVGERVNDQIASRILSEFPDQKLEVAFVDLQPISESSSHIAFHGSGLVDFADEGTAPVAFSAILDRASGLVIALDYSLEVAGAHGIGDESFARSIAASP